MRWKLVQQVLPNRITSTNVFLLGSEIIGAWEMLHEPSALRNSCNLHPLFSSVPRYGSSQWKTLLFPWLFPEWPRKCIDSIHSHSSHILKISCKYAWTVANVLRSCSRVSGVGRGNGPDFANHLFPLLKQQFIIFEYIPRLFLFFLPSKKTTFSQFLYHFKT